MFKNLLKYFQKLNGAETVAEGQMFRILDLLSFYICSYISYAITGNAFWGAIIFIAGLILQIAAVLYSQKLQVQDSRHESAQSNIPESGIPESSQGTKLCSTRSLRLKPYLIAVIICIVPAASAVIFDSPLMLLAGVAAVMNLRAFLTHGVILIQKHNLKHRIIFTAMIELACILAMVLLIRLSTDFQFTVRIGMLLLVYPVSIILWLLRNRKRNIVETVNYSASAMSYRMYNALLLNSNIALYLSMMSYVGMLLLIPDRDGLFLPVISWVALVITITVVIGRLIRTESMRRFEKNTLFIGGGILWLFAHTQLNERFSLFDPSMAWIWSLLQAVGIAVMMLIATYMQEDMRLVLELTGEDSETSIKTSRSVMQRLAFIIAGIFISIEVYLISLLYEGKIELSRKVYSNLMWIMNVLPLVFVLLSISFAILQPVSREIVQKLKLYRKQKMSHSIIPAFEERLRKILVRPYRKPIAIKIVAFLFKPWFYTKVTGTEIVNFDDGPVIFVANHRDVYGPIVTYLYFPFSYRPWIENNILSRDKVHDYIKVFLAKKIHQEWLAEILTKIFAQLSVWLLNSIDPIPVFRRMDRKQTIETIRKSVTALQEQDNLLIFPEDPKLSEGAYATEGVSPFFKGFVMVGKSYYKNTGKSITFYPVYSDPVKRIITVSEGIRYNPVGESEPDRICNHLMEEMNRIGRSGGK